MIKWETRVELRYAALYSDFLEMIVAALITTRGGGNVYSGHGK